MPKHVQSFRRFAVYRGLTLLALLTVWSLLAGGYFALLAETTHLHVGFYGAMLVFAGGVCIYLGHRAHGFAVGTIYDLGVAERMLVQKHNYAVDKENIRSRNRPSL